MKFLNRMAQATMALLMFAGVSAHAQTLTFDSESYAIAPGEEKEITVSLVSDADKTYATFDLLVDAPEGLSYVVVNEYDEYAIFGEQNPKHMTNAAVSASNNQQLVIGMNHKNRALVDGPLFTFKVKADDTFAGGTIKLINILFCNSTTDYKYLDEVSVMVEKAEPTAISNVELGTKAEKVYSLSGAERKAAVKGQLNIIRNADGTVTKVLK